MRYLYLIRHATPAVQPNVPAPEWQLADRGIEETRALATTAREWDIAALYSSREPKARSTALIIGDALNLPVNVVDGLEETRLDWWIANSDEFADAVRLILEQPALSLRGAERAEAAAARFASAISIIEQGPFPAVVVTHGRVLTAWLAQAAGVEDPFSLWRSIPMPGWTRVDLDDLRAEAVPPFRA
jgi:broad specificity phosphatase PhoE